MNRVIFVTLLLVASALADQSVEVVSSPQQASVQGPAPVHQSSQQQSPPSSNIVGVQPVVESAPVVHQPAPVHVVAEPHQHQHQHQHPNHPEHASHEAHQYQHQHQQHQHHSQAPPAAVSYYSPAAGLIQVVGNEHQVKPVVGAVRNFEQYGQPESASIPANYKPFGSWGLYIGGNPADGYYTNYYKALGNSVADKQQQQAADQVKPPVSASSGSVSQTAAFSPVLRQASSSPYLGADYYPFAYSPADLSVHSNSYQPPVVGAGVAPQVYSSGELPAGPYLSYADQYATKRLGGQAPIQQQQQQQQQVQQVPSKGYQQRLSYVSYPAAAPAVYGQQQQQQVVAYPVPVGSQIVGSQPGVDGAFNPYGIHAFTRYAVKPTVVSSDATYYAYSYPSYKQQSTASSSAAHQAHQAPAGGVPHQPFNFYGYPLSQLHYSQGSIVPVAGVEAGPVAAVSHQVIGHSAPSSSSSSSSSSVGSAGPVDQSVSVVEAHQAHGLMEPVAASDKSETVLKEAKSKN